MTWTLMHKNIKVLDMELHDQTANIQQILNVYNIPHIPLGVCSESGKLSFTELDKWWNGRAIPASR
ncbi:MAG: excisionase, partial [Oscillospiraceae bacterium]|nr:excisionase [Oscillospiraceae bacterium]